MNRSPYISILSATLNNIDTIERALESVRRQCFKSFEHVVVDGGSRDGTLEVIRQYGNKYNLKWISEPDHGISDALNKGLRLSSGRYIIVIQADDQLLNLGILEKVFPYLRKEQIDIMGFPVVLDDPVRGNVLRKPIRLLWWNHFKFIFLHQGTFVHRRVFDRIGNFKEQFSIAMDYDFFYRALSSHCTVNFGATPVALMGGSGVGSRINIVKKRILEEFLVQKTNEKSLFWRAAQFLFRSLYFPYKTHLMPTFGKEFVRSNPLISDIDIPPAKAVCREGSESRLSRKGP